MNHSRARSDFAGSPKATSSDSRSGDPARTASTGASWAPTWWFEGAYLRVGVVRELNVVVIERTASSPAQADPAEIFGPAEEALREIEREKFALLVDVRQARGRNDREFERRFEPLRQSLQRGFRRVAVLVSTPLGKLQVQRYAREDRTNGAAFDDFHAAVAWLSEPTPGLSG